MQVDNAALVGTTAVVALIGDRQLYVGNCGASPSGRCWHQVLWLQPRLALGSPTSALLLPCTLRKQGHDKLEQFAMMHAL